MKPFQVAARYCKESSWKILALLSQQESTGRTSEKKEHKIQRQPIRKAQTQKVRPDGMCRTPTAHACPRDLASRYRTTMSCSRVLRSCHM